MDVGLGEMEGAVLKTYRRLERRETGKKEEIKMLQVRVNNERRPPFITVDIDAKQVKIKK